MAVSSLALGNLAEPERLCSCRGAVKWKFVYYRLGGRRERKAASFPLLALSLCSHFNGSSFIKEDYSLTHNRQGEIREGHIIATGTASYHMQCITKKICRHV